MKRKPETYLVDDHKRSSFWFGFALGASTAGSAIFFLGTKKGRATLKKVLELSEGLEEVVFDALKELGVETLHEVADNLSPKLKRSFTALDEPKNTVGSFLDKVKRFSSKST